MDNQHRKISGYRELSQEEIDLMNRIKSLGPTLQELVDALRENQELDQRWVSIGATHLQQGLMALTRGVAQPTFF
jgi:fumarate hydratase class II